MYRKVLIPLDGSREAEMVIPKIQPELAEDGEVILLKIIPPLKGETLGQITVTSSEREEAERVKAIDYLREVMQRFEGSPSQWHWKPSYGSQCLRVLPALPTRRG